MANRLNVANIGYNDATDALTIDSSGNVTAAGTLSAGTISEAVADAGVSIDGVVAKDSKVFAPSGIVFASAEITGDDASTTGRVESSNLLDDYEAGTWTATFTGSATTITGYYTKVGRLVNAFVYGGGINVTSVVNAIIGGLPFQAGGDYAAGSITHNTYATNAENGYMGNGGTDFYLINNDNTTPAKTVVGDPKYIMMSVSYIVT